MSETKLEILMSEEEASKYLNSFKEKMGYKDISSIVKSTNDNSLNNNNEEDQEEIKKLKIIRSKLIEGIRIGIILFDEENKGITQKLLYPYDYNGIKVEELCFFKKLKLKDIKNITQGKEADVLIKNIATMTNEKQEKIEELDTNDFDYTSSIYAFLQKK
ncbi:MAG TPA: hypothetical protein VLL98_00135 [Rickettsiales bacterium]|nr:hypothetical protein [Rickettsiales bacterium]